MFTVLLRKRATTVCEYLASQGTFMKNMLRHLQSHSIVELLLTILGVEAEERPLIPMEMLDESKLLGELVSRLQETYSTEINAHAALVLRNIIERSAPGTALWPMVEQLQSDQLQHLVDYSVKATSTAAFQQTLTVLLAMLADSNADDEQDRAFGNAGSDSDDSKEDGGAADGGAPTTDDTTPLLAAIAAQLPVMTQRLDEELPGAVMSFGRLEHKLGLARLTLVEFLCALLKRQNSEVTAQFVELDLLEKMLGLFFRFKWNNMLHGFVAATCREALESQNKPLVASLLGGEQGLVRRLVDEFSMQEGDSERRVGYMGQALSLANLIHDSECAVVKGVLDGLSGPCDTVFPKRAEADATAAAAEAAPDAGGAADAAGTAAEATAAEAAAAPGPPPEAAAGPQTLAMAWRAAAEGPLCGMNERAERALGGRRPGTYDDDSDDDEMYQIMAESFSNAVQVQRNASDSDSDSSSDSGEENDDDFNQLASRQEDDDDFAPREEGEAAADDGFAELAGGAAGSADFDADFDGAAFPEPPVAAAPAADAPAPAAAPAAADFDADFGAFDAEYPES